MDTGDVRLANADLGRQFLPARGDRSLPVPPTLALCWRRTSNGRVLGSPGAGSIGSHLPDRQPRVSGPHFMSWNRLLVS